MAERWVLRTGCQFPSLFSLNDSPASHSGAGPRAREDTCSRCSPPPLKAWGLRISQLSSGSSGDSDVGEDGDVQAALARGGSTAGGVDQEGRSASGAASLCHERRALRFPLSWRLWGPAERLPFESSVRRRGGELVRGQAPWPPCSHLDGVEGELSTMAPGRGCPLPKGESGVS